MSHVYNQHNDDIKQLFRAFLFRDSQTFFHLFSWKIRMLGARVHLYFVIVIEIFLFLFLFLFQKFSAFKPLKFSFSEKATKICTICLMVLTFTKVLKFGLVLEKEKNWGRIRKYYVEFQHPFCRRLLRPVYVTFLKTG